MAETRTSKAAPKAAAKRKTAAKTKTAAKPKVIAKTPKPKAAKPRAASKTSAAPKKTAASKPRRAAARAEARSPNAGFDVAKLMDHPLVADLLTVGAMAAIAAIADHNVKSRTGEAAPGSTKAVKAAGKAVASAIGKRLLTEVDQVRSAKKATD